MPEKIEETPADLFRAPHPNFDCDLAVDGAVNSSRPPILTKEKRTLLVVLNREPKLLVSTCLAYSS